MADRDTNLALLKGLKRPRIAGDSYWMGCLEVELATSEGACVWSIQDGTGGPDGPVSVDAERHRELLSALNKGRAAVEALFDPEGDDEQTFIDELALVACGCEPDTDYYKLELEPIRTLADALEEKSLKGAVVFAKTEEELVPRWADELGQFAEDYGLDSWDDMDDEELEEWVEKLGLNEGEAV